jgi:hypothetical protein
MKTGELTFGYEGTHFLLPFSKGEDGYRDRQQCSTHMFIYVRFEVSAAIKMWIVVFWFVVLCSLVGDRGASLLHFNGRRWRQY